MEPLDIRSILDRYKLNRAERKLQVLRVRQRDVRQDIKELESNRGDMGFSPEEYHRTLAKLEESKTALTEAISETRQQKLQLEERLEHAEEPEGPVP